MNKKEFLETLKDKLSYSMEECIIIDEVLESNFFISRKSEGKIKEELKERLKIDEKEALRIYEIAITLVKDEIKNKLKHPFKSKD